MAEPKYPKVPLPPGRRECSTCFGRGHRGPKVNARSKGQRGEREVVRLLQTVVDIVHAKHKLEPLIIQRNALQAHLGGCDLHGLEGFAVEVKFCETLNLTSWWAQTLRQAAALKAVPILLYRSAGEDWTVKWRCFINTPADRDQVELDVESELDEFLRWFEAAYEERVTNFERDVFATPHIVVTERTPLPCTCLTEPLKHCEFCHH